MPPPQTLFRLWCLCLGARKECGISYRPAELRDSLSFSKATPSRLSALLVLKTGSHGPLLHDRCPQPFFSLSPGFAQRAQRIDISDQRGERYRDEGIQRIREKPDSRPQNRPPLAD